MREINYKSIIIILCLVIAVIGVLIAVCLPVIQENKDRAESGKILQNARDIFALVLKDQNDGALADGTVVKMGGKDFICVENRLSAAERTPDIVAAVTMAIVDGEDAVVYLFAVDGDDVAHKDSDKITYVKIIDPDDQAIETYTYSQVNPAVQNFLDEVSYENAQDTVSKISQYVDESKRYDRPAGCVVDLEAGELTVFDNGTQNAYTVIVEKGPYTFYNITPGVGGEFYVKNGDTIVQRGHLRPTGTLRMIYSDTQGLQNMRDLGGWPCDGGTIRYNMIIRGGMVVDATDADRNTWVKLLGIDHDLFAKTYSDTLLQGREEFRTQSPLGVNVDLYQNDLSAENSENKRNFSQAKEQMNGIMNRLFDNAIAGETTYFHCLAGADRTGMIAILVEGVLGVSKGDIDRDYELTSFSSLRERNNEGYVADMNILRSYDGAAFRDQCIRYLLDCGISLDKINTFRKAVIDGDPEIITDNMLGTNPNGTNFCVPDGEGWLDKGRCSSTGEDRHDAESYTLTNYFPVKNGDIVYVKNLDIADKLFSGIYQANKLPIAGFCMTNSEGMGYVKDIHLNGEWERFTVDHAEASYMRLCGILTSGKKDVVIHIQRNGEWVAE